MITPTPLKPVRILLADDDQDDHYLFSRALKSLSFTTQLTMVDNGEALMKYLVENSTELPDILFLDHNMPRKNGAECLREIKNDPKLNRLPVIMYSTYVHEDMSDAFYMCGAHYYIKKTDQKDLRKLLQHVLSLFTENKFFLPSRENFILRAAHVLTP